MTAEAGRLKSGRGNQGGCTVLVPAVVLLVAAGVSLAVPVDTFWVRRYTGPDTMNVQFNRAGDIATDARGNVYVCGSGELSQNPPNQTEFLLAKYSEWGDLRWVRSMVGPTGSSSDNMAHALAIDSAGNVYVVGVTDCGSRGLDCTWIKYDSSGNQLWTATKSGYGDDDVAFDVAIGKQGQVYVCGTRFDTVYSLSAFSVYRLRPDSGYVVWSRHYILDTLAFGRQSGDRHPDFVYWDDWWDWDNCADAMEVGADSCLVVTGFGYHRNREYQMWTMKFRDSTRLWEHEYYQINPSDRDEVAFDVAVAANNYIYLTGFVTNYNYDYDLVVARYAPTGGAPTTAMVPGAGQGDDYGVAVCLDDSSLQNVYVTGFLEAYGAPNHYQVWTQKYSAGLIARWGGGSSFGGATNDYGFDVAYKAGRAYVTGMANNDLVALAYNCQNTNPHDTLWARYYNAPMNQRDWGAVVCATDSDHVYVGGESDRPAVMGFVQDMVTSRFGHTDPDLRAKVVLEPSDTVDYGDTITPRVRIVNEGNTRAKFWTRLTIGATYRDSVGDTSWLNPGDSAVRTFATWVAQPPGFVALRCSVAYNGDNDPSNNLLRDSVFVAMHDVGCMSIAQPSGTVDSGTVLQPQAWLRNYGSVQENFSVWLSVAPDYVDTVSVSLNPGDSVLQAFANWTGRWRGTWPTACSTLLTGDFNAGNNLAFGLVTIRVADAALTEILAPPDTLDSGATTAPSVEVVNAGTEAVNGWAYFTLDNGADAIVYSESLSVALGPGESDSLAFPGSQPLTRIGTWTARARIAVAGDQHPENDTASKRVRVRPVGVSWPPGWVEVNAIPSMPSTRAVKDGGWLAIDPAQDLLYCGKGYKTGDFYSRPVLGSTWTQLTLIPNGVEAKPPYKGAVGCADGFGHVYLTKGNNTQGFWRYVADSLVWRQLAPVPMGISGKRVKGGTDVVFVMHGDTGYVYLLKGYKQDFFRYNTRTGVWDTTLPLAPAGAKAKWDKGSWLVYDEAGRLYAHKAKYHEMWTFDLSGRSWSATPLPGMPFVGGMGRTKKSKDGGCGAWFDGSIFALKGGNTQEYWQFSSGPGTWTELETIPAFGSTGRKKRVKAGGDIVYSTYALWALKGNKTLEFWRYGLLLTAAAPRPERAGVMAGPGHAAGRAAVAPSVVADGRLKLLVSGSGPAVLTLYDAAGRVAFNRSVVLQGPVISVDVGSLPAGVYLARLDTEAGATTRTKVVLR